MAYSYDGYLRFNTEVDQSGFNNGVNSMKSAAAMGAKAIGIGLATATTAVTALSTVAIAAGSNFEAGMSKVQATSQASAADMELLSAKAKEMGATTKFSATQSAEALNYMAMAGWKTQQSIQGLPAIMDLAAASGEDLANISDIVTDAITAFGLQASDSGHFADVLAAAASNANTNVGMMGYTFKYAAPLAGALGYSIEDTAVAIGLMANAGIKSETAGTALRSMFSKMTGTVELTGEKLGKYVIEMERTNGSMAPLSETMLSLREAFSKMTEAEKIANAESLVGREAMSGLLAIVNASEADYNKLKSAIEGADGAAKSMAKTANDNLKGDLTILGSTAESVGIQIYEKFQEPMRKAAQSATKSLGGVLSSLNSGQLDKSVDKIADAAGNLLSVTAKLAADGLPKLINGFALIIDNAPKIVVAASSMAAALGVFKTALVIDKELKAATIAINAYRASSTILATSLTSQQLIIGGLTGKVGLNTVATSLATKAQLAFNASILANPAVWVVGGIAALAAGLFVLDKQQSETEQSTRRLNDALEEQRQAREEAEKARRDSINGAVAEVDHASDLIDKFDGIIDSNGKIKEGYEGRAQALRDQINSILPNAINLSEKEGDMYLKVADDLGVLIEKKRISALIDANQESYSQAIRDQNENVNSLRDANEKLAESKANLQKIEEDYAKAVADGKIIIDIGPNNLERQREDAKKSVEATQKSVEDAVKALEDGTKRITDQENLMAAAHSGNIETMKNAVDEMLNTQVSYTNKSKEEMDKQLSNTIGNYQSLYQVTMESGGQINDAQFDLLVKSRQNLLKEIDSYLATGEKIPQNLAAGIASTAQEYKNSIENLVKGGKITAEQSKELMKLAGVDWGKEIAKGNESDEVKTQISSAAEGNAFLTMTTTRSAWKIENGKSSEGAKLGGYYTAGVASGISSQESIAKIQNSANIMAQAADRATRRALDINSPSKVGEKTGGFYPDGVAKGIIDNKYKVVDAVRTMSDDSIKTSKEKAGSYKELGSLYIDQMKTGINAQRDSLIDQIEKLVDDNTEKHIEALGKDNDKAKSKYRESATELMSTYRKALQAGADKANALVSEKIQGITEEAQKQYDEIIRQRDRMQNKLSDFGDLFTRDEDGKVQLENINDQTDALKRYQSALEELQYRGISGGLLQEILDLGVEDGTDLAEKLLKNDGVFQQYNEAWTLKQEAAKVIAQQFYADELTTLDTDFTQKLDTALATIPEECTDVGVDAIQGTIDGMNSKKDDAVRTAKDIADAIIKELKRATETASPSKRAAREVGKPITQGVIKGMNDAYDPKELQAYTNRMMADIGQAQSKAAQSVLQKNTSNVWNSATYNGGDFILKVEKMVNDGKGSVASLLQEAEFYRKQKVSATGGV